MGRNDPTIESMQETARNLAQQAKKLREQAKDLSREAARVRPRVKRPESNCVTGAKNNISIGVTWRFRGPSTGIT